MATQKIETGLIADSAVTTAKIADNSVTGAKIAAASLDDQVKGISSSADAVAITIDSSENVGIGETSPDTALHVKTANDTVAVIESSDATSKILIKDGDSTYGTSLCVTNEDFFMQINGGEKLRVDSSGNLGLGTSSPNSYSGQTALTINSTGVARLDLDISNTRQGYVLAESGYLGIFADSGKTLRLGAGGDEDIRILASGYVGIGTQSPAAPLDVAGNFIFKSPTNTLYGNFDTTTAGYGAFRLQNQGSNYGFIGQTSSLLASGGSNTALGLRSENEFAIATGGSTERMRIDSSGNLLLGTTSFNTGAFGSAKGINVSATQPLILVHESDTDKDGFMGISNSVMFLGTADAIPLRFSTNDAERMRIDSAGTIYQGTTTPTLHSAVRGIVFENGSILNDVTRAAGRSITLAQNAAVDSGNTWAYLATDEASYYQQFNGNHYFATAPSGSAGSDVTFETKLQINNAGLVTTPSQPFFMTNRSAGNQTFANVAWVDLDWTGEPYDTGNNYTLSSGVFTAPVAGVYLFTGLIGFDTIAATNYVLARMVCSTAGDFYTTHEQKRSGGGDYGYDHAISQMVYLAASETVKMQVFAGGGGNHTIGSRSNWQGRLLG